MSVTAPCPLVSLGSPFFSSLACSLLVQLWSSRTLVLLLVSISGADPCSLADCAARTAQLWLTSTLGSWWGKFPFPSLTGSAAATPDACDIFYSCVCHGSLLGTFGPWDGGRCDLFCFLSSPEQQALRLPHPCNVFESWGEVLLIKSPRPADWLGLPSHLQLGEQRSLCSVLILNVSVLMQERRPTWCRGACPDLVWENFVLMLFSSSLENSWRNQGRSPCWVGLWWKMLSCLLLRPWMNRRPALPQRWRSISWKITQGPTPTSRVKYWFIYCFYSACWESSAAADVPVQHL